MSSPFEKKKKEKSREKRRRRNVRLKANENPVAKFENFRGVEQKVGGRVFRGRKLNADEDEQEDTGACS